MTITEFLTARYDEEEALWSQAVDQGLLLSLPDGVPALAAQGTAERFLRDIAAKREIMAIFLDVQKYVRLAPEGKAMADGARVSRETLRLVLIALAQPYADHPDFDPAWRVA